MQNHGKKRNKIIAKLREEFLEKEAQPSLKEEMPNYHGLAEDLIAFTPDKAKYFLPRILIEALTEKKPFEERESDLVNLLMLLNVDEYPASEVEDEKVTGLRKWKEAAFKSYSMGQARAIYDCLELLGEIYDGQEPFDFVSADDYDEAISYWRTRCQRE